MLLYAIQGNQGSHYKQDSIVNPQRQSGRDTGPAQMHTFHTDYLPLIKHYWEVDSPLPYTQFPTVLWCFYALLRVYFAFLIFPKHALLSDFVNDHTKA